MSCYYGQLRNGAWYAKPVSNRQEFLALRESERQREAWTHAKAGDDQWKLKLVRFYYNAHFEGDGKVAGNGMPSQTFAIDYDDPQTAQEVRQQLYDRREELGCLMIEVTRSGGFHAVCMRPVGRPFLKLSIGWLRSWVVSSTTMPTTTNV